MMVVAAIGVGGFSALVTRQVMSARRAAPPKLVGAARTGISRVVVLGIGAALAGFVLLLAMTGSPGIAMPISVGFAFLPHVVLVRRAHAANRRTLEAWPEALRAIRSSLLAGRSLHAALSDLVHAGPQPLRPMFFRYVRVAATLDQGAALEVIRDESDDPYVDRIVEVLVAAVDAGPATVLDIIDDLAEAAMEDLQLRMRIETAGLEQRINAGMIMAVPIGMLLLLNSVSPMYRSFYNSPLGFTVVSLGMGLSLLGMLTVRRLAVLPSEPRVFASKRSNA
jgi:tight adherence protein B